MHAGSIIIGPALSFNIIRGHQRVVSAEDELRLVSLSLINKFQTDVAISWLVIHFIQDGRRLL
jgi:hypothetical protein